MTRFSTIIALNFLLCASSLAGTLRLTDQAGKWTYKNDDKGLYEPCFKIDKLFISSQGPGFQCSNVQNEYGKPTILCSRGRGTSQISFEIWVFRRSRPADPIIAASFRSEATQGVCYLPDWPQSIKPAVSLRLE